MRKYHIMTCLTLLMLSVNAQAQMTREIEPVKTGHATPGWVKVEGPQSVSKSQLKKHMEKVYGLQGGGVKVEAPGADAKNCKMIKGNVKICQKD